jgi:ABC-type transport system involved in cytochrome c biogenesis permease subunit
MWVFLACVFVVTLVAVLLGSSTDGDMVRIMFGPVAGGAIGYVLTTCMANRTNAKIAEIKKKPAR